MASKNVEKTRARLEKRIEEGAYYEAHQQLRVVSQRYIKAQDYEAAIDILCSGAEALLKAGQGGSGGDLCLMLVEVYKTGNVTPSATSRARLIQLISLISPEEPSRKRFINEAIAWSSKHGEYPAGDPELHHFIGKLFAQEDNTYEAEKHLVVGTKESAEVFADMLYEWYTEDEPHTAPIYAARAVFPYMLIGNLRDATRSLTIFTRKLIENNPSLAVQEVQTASVDVKVIPSLPLLNFLNLLLLACQTGEQDMFRTLKSHYSNSLKEVPHCGEALAQIGEIYFGIQVPRTASLFDMMGSMFGGAPNAAPQSRQIAPEQQPFVDLD
ncbi:DUF410-domain-containing protein [Choiromyces venosus 120613-1]|uniref:DUF410-domain-containing protein n=1 Tax=Choiromyces venosus 120613-1 TaxID=1336337 RepID=A0A3N4K075_9PEZI|nr:DUF410-domain-containing protein [Choiromyces venosus 120613-1]